MFLVFMKKYDYGKLIDIKSSKCVDNRTFKVDYKNRTSREMLPQFTKKKLLILRKIQNTLQQSMEKRFFPIYFVLFHYLFASLPQ